MHYKCIWHELGFSLQTHTYAQIYTYTRYVQTYTLMQGQAEKSDGIYISVINKNIRFPCRSCHKMLLFSIIGISYHVN
jgi:hypothetical protein